MHSVCSAVYYGCVRLAELPAILEDKENGNDGNEIPDISTKLLIRRLGMKECFVEVKRRKCIEAAICSIGLGVLCDERH